MILCVQGRATGELFSSRRRHRRVPTVFAGVWPALYIRCLARTGGEGGGGGAALEPASCDVFIAMLFAGVFLLLTIGV